jgi:hypothetical protein
LPLRHAINYALRLVHAEGHGVVTVSEICDYFDDVVVKGAMPYRKLFDLSRCEVNVDDDAMMALGARVAAYAAYDPRGPIAVVASNPDTLLAVQRFFNLGGAARPGNIFDSVDEARAWLDSQS